MPRDKSAPIQTPGEALGAAAAADDDLADFESDELPAAQAAPASVAGLSPELAKLVESMVANGVAKALAANSRPAAGTPVNLPTQAAARAMCEDAVANGVRPRPILTADGWYTHPEMARAKTMGAKDEG